MTAAEAHRAIDAVWRIESARLIAALTRMVRDVGLAEELAQDALVAALERWPETGIPENPGAWLMATAKNRAIDQLRRNKMALRKHEAIEDDAPTGTPRAPSFETALDEDGSARGAHALPPRRPDHGGGSARVPRAGAHHRAAHHPREAHARRTDTSRTLVGPGCPLPRNSGLGSTESHIETAVHLAELVQGEEAGVSLGALVAGEVGLGDAGQLCDRLLREPTL